MALLSLSASAGLAPLTPTGNYTITLTRGTWTRTFNVVGDNPSISTDYINGSKTVIGSTHGLTMSVEKEIQQDTDISAYCYYIDWTNNTYPGNPDNPDILGGSGDLTITISGLKFAETDATNVYFSKDVTHIYYLCAYGKNDINGNPIMDIPGSINTNKSNPLDGVYVRTPIRPVNSSEEDYSATDGYYGTPSYYRDWDSSDECYLSITLPDLVVPSGANYEVSFGLGFSSPVPEPLTLTLLSLGVVGLMRKKC
jgi:hypothetical protein